MHELVNKYGRMRDELRERHPAAWAEVVRLSRGVSAVVDKQAVWSCGRDKPCFSNIRVAVGERLARDLERCSAFESFERIAAPAWTVHFKGDRSPAWRRNTNFEVLGSEVVSFVASSDKGLLSSYLWRLFAIRGLASALVHDDNMASLVAMLGKWAANGDIHFDRLQRWTRQFKDAVGRGWGVVTAYHLLTDLGLTVKPDLHLCRAAIHMGMLPGASAEEARQPSEKLQHEAVRKVIELARQVKPTAWPESSFSLREVDKVLMEWSRQGLAHSH